MVARIATRPASPYTPRFRARTPHEAGQEQRPTPAAPDDHATSPPPRGSGRFLRRRASWRAAAGSHRAAPAWRHSRADAVARARGAVRTRQETPRVAGDEEPEQPADSRDEFGDPPAYHTAHGSKGRVLEPSLLRHCAERRKDREQAEQEDRPGAERDRRPALEHDGREVRGLEQHVPETQGASEVDREQQPAHDRADGRDPISGADDGAVVGPSEPLQQRRQEVGTAGEPAHEEVRDDEPGPMWRAAEEGVGHISSVLPLPGRPYRPSGACAGWTIRAARKG